MIITCSATGKSFEFIQVERELMDKVAPEFNGQKYTFPDPTLSPQERRQRRMVFRNELKLYHRKCDSTGKQIISVYRTEVPFPVYAFDVWFGDSWDASDYSQDFDFTRPFFAQYKELQLKVPHPALISSNNTNSDFCNIVGNSKNCYLIAGSINCQDCYYGIPFSCTDCADSLLLRNSELCIECMDSTELYGCYHCQDCVQSRNLWYCLSVENSNDCFACVGLNRKEYCILNEQFTEEEYKKRLKEILTNEQVLKDVLQKFEELKLRIPRRYYVGKNNENVSGDYIFNSKDVHSVYNVDKCRDVVNATQLLDVKDAAQIDYGEIGELLYDIMGFYNNVQKSAFLYWCWDGVYNVFYSGNCIQNVQNLFGCVGMKKASYCILNKQYTKEEYEEMVPKIIEHMQKTGEWGQFFPMSISPFAYNETVAQDYYPLTKDTAEAKGSRWIDDDTSKLYRGPEYTVPYNVQDATPDLCDRILSCEVTNRPYKIIPQELELHRKLGMSLPSRCPDQRHLDRLAKRNPRRLWDRRCSKCYQEIKTSFDPIGGEIVYCEKCYQQAVF